jgi:hypothetical protein
MSTWTSWLGSHKPAEPSVAETPKLAPVPTQRKSYRDALFTPPVIVACPSIDDSYVLVSPVSNST